MDEINDSPSEINSSRVCKELHANMMDLKKKRKLQAEQLDLPIPKHKCWGRSFSSHIVYPFNKSTEIDYLKTQIVKGETEGETLDDGSEPESAKDSNSLAEDSDSAMSVYGEAKFEAECEKACPYNQPSRSSVNWGSSSSRDNLHSLNSTTDANGEKLAFLDGEHNPPNYYGGLQVSQNLEEQLMEFGNHVDYMCSQFGNEMIEDRTDKELEDMLYPNGMKPNNYVLSSGRWSVNQGNFHMKWNAFALGGEDDKCLATSELQLEDDAQSGTRKPTIDQEFEQYFSMLML